MPQAAPAAAVPADPHAGQLLQPAWEIRAPQGQQLLFQGTVDTNGNLFWIEQVPNTSATTLASADIGGNLRFRTPIDQGEVMVWAAGTVVIAGAQQSPGISPTAIGYSSATGQVLWRTALWPFFQSAQNTNGFDARFGQAVAVQGTVLLSLNAEGGGGTAALDAATGKVLWASRTLSGSPGFTHFAVSSNETLFATQFLVHGDDVFDQLLRGPARTQPGVFFTGGPNDRDLDELFAAPASVLISSVNTGPKPARPAVRCQSGGQLIAQFGDDVSLLAGVPGGFWLSRGSDLLRYDASDGALAAAVHFAPPLPPVDSSQVVISAPLRFQLASAAGLLWVQQQATIPRNGNSGDRVQGPATLFVIAPDGRELLNRMLPLEGEAYDLANGGVSFGDRVLLPGELLPSAGAFGVIRAFDIPGWGSGQVKP